MKSREDEVAWKISNSLNADNAVLLKELKTLSLPKLAHENICQMVMHMNINGNEYLKFKKRDACGFTLTIS